MLYEMYMYPAISRSGEIRQHILFFEKVPSLRSLLLRWTAAAAAAILLLMELLSVDVF
jgi:hypothetical protein